MAVSFLTAAQRDRYGRYPDVVTPNDLSRCFHLSDDDRAQIMSCRGHHNRLGFPLQLSTVRYLGTFLDDPWSGASVPHEPASGPAAFDQRYRKPRRNSLRFWCKLGPQSWRHKAQKTIRQ